MYVKAVTLYTQRENVATGNDDPGSEICCKPSHQIGVTPNGASLRGLFSRHRRLLFPSFCIIYTLRWNDHFSLS